SNGVAQMRGEKIVLLDHHTFPNAMFGGGPAPTPAELSFTVRYKLPVIPVTSDEATTAGGIWQDLTIDDIANRGRYSGQVLRGLQARGAQMEWTAKVGDWVYRSDDMSTSTSSFAEIGHIRNGVYFVQQQEQDPSPFAEPPPLETRPQTQEPLD